MGRLLRILGLFPSHKKHKVSFVLLVVTFWNGTPNASLNIVEVVTLFVRQ